MDLRNEDLKTVLYENGASLVGSAVRLSSLVTDAPLTCGTPVTASRCEACAACTNPAPAERCQGNCGARKRIGTVSFIRSTAGARPAGWPQKRSAGKLRCADSAFMSALTRRDI